MGNREKAIANFLQKWEEEYRAGNAARVLDVISLCLQFDHVVPRWAINHFVCGAGRYERAEAWKLEDAFDIHRPKSQHQNHVRDRRQRGLAACLVAHALHECKDYSFDEAIAEVASKFHMSKATAERWYYDQQLTKELGYPQTVRRRSKKTEGD